MGITKVFNTPFPIFKDPTIDAVVICTSTNTHAELIIEAAKSGKSIFCEKPIALDLNAIDRALESVDKAGVILQVGFNRRFDTNFSRARKLVSQGQVGKVEIVRITSRDPEPPPIEYVKSSGGIFLDMMIHDFDMARYITNDEVEEISATGAVLVDPQIGQAGDVDTAIVTLRFQKGGIGVIDNSRRSVYGYDQRLEVFGEKGSIFVQNPKPTTTMTSSNQGTLTPPLFHFFLERYKDSYIIEMKEFIKCIQNNNKPPVTGLDGKIAVVMGYAAKRSLEKHSTVLVKEIGI